MFIIDHNCWYRFILCPYANVSCILTQKVHFPDNDPLFKTFQDWTCPTLGLSCQPYWMRYKMIQAYQASLKLFELYLYSTQLSVSTVKEDSHNAHWEPRNGLQQLRQSIVKIRFPEVEHTSALNRQTPPVFNLGILRYLVTVAWRNMNLSCAVSEANMDILKSQNFSCPDKTKKLTRQDVCCTVLHLGGIGTVEVSNRCHGGNNLVLALLTEILYYYIL